MNYIDTKCKFLLLHINQNKLTVMRMKLKSFNMTIKEVIPMRFQRVIVKY
jgi:uncharacterized protein YlbG (UPF0298 family)